jgi:hypothetical protein
VLLYCKIYGFLLSSASVGVGEHIHGDFILTDMLKAVFYQQVLLGIFSHWIFELHADQTC